MFSVKREDLSEMTDEEYKEALISLRRKGLIEIREVDGKLKHVLTPMGELVYQTLDMDPRRSN